MAIETFEFIDDLNAANPTATDNVSEGDDHLRGLKTTLKNTFPNVTGAINATEAELNILDGVTSTAAELNILDGVTATAAELNILDGVTATTAELNYVDGVTSNIQTQLDNIDTDLLNDTTPQLGGNLDTQSFTVDGRDVSTDGTKLDTVATSANNYAHPTGAGNLHVPTGGTVDQVLTNTASGTGTWQDAAGGGFSNIASVKTTGRSSSASGYGGVAQSLTFTPSGTSIVVTGSGAGGGGNGGYKAGSSGCSVRLQVIPVTAGVAVTINSGRGGSGNSGSGEAGTAGTVIQSGVTLLTLGAGGSGSAQAGGVAVAGTGVTLNGFQGTGYSENTNSQISQGGFGTSSYNFWRTIMVYVGEGGLGYDASGGFAGGEGIIVALY